jgi:biotin-(acetyl-CoA carboxylase) ligase
VPYQVRHSHASLQEQPKADSPRPPGSYNHSKQKKGSRSKLLPSTRTREAVTERIDLPPPFTLVRLRESGEAFAHALGIAAESGAGTLVYVGRFDLAEFAVVLEPAEPLRSARRAFYAGMVAMADALRAYAPPNKAVTIDWPDAIRVDGGLVGGGRLGWPKSAREDDVPPWLVFGAMIRTVSLAETEAGLRPLVTALEEEGFGEAGAAEVTESFARHLMVAFDHWQVDGFASLAHQYLALMERQPQTSRRIEANGDLVVQRIGAEHAAPIGLVRALAKPTWLDPKSGGPRL